MDIWTPDAGQNILTRGVTKTGQTIQYRAGDDGQFETGWWIGRLNANNRTRFIARTIGGDDIVLDRATGLMWAANQNQAGCNNDTQITWANGIDYALALNFAGFTDWRMPQIKELNSIVDYEAGVPFVDLTFFPNARASRYWASTTNILIVANAWVIDFTQGYTTNARPKTESNFIRCVRKGI